LRVGRVKGHDRELGESQVASRPEGGEGAEEGQVSTVEAELVLEHDLVRRRQVVAILLGGHIRVGGQLLVQRFQFGIAGRCDLAPQSRKQEPLQSERLEICGAIPSGCSAIRSAFAGGARSSGATSRFT
jgi:hypothetical protein